MCHFKSSMGVNISIIRKFFNANSNSYDTVIHQNFNTLTYNNMSVLRIATRNSPLALWQANYVKDRLIKEHKDLQVEIVGMTTKGDQMLDRTLSKVGGKGLFLKELQVSLLNGETDIAVHSMKDVPVALPKGLEITTFCDREDPRDAFVSNNYQNLYALPKGARVGTSSLRRVVQLKNVFPALEFVELRGNVNTRLAKLDNGDYDAIILAAAGLIRLDLENRIKQYITPDLCLPAVGQGVVGIECRDDDEQTRALLKPLHSPESDLLLAAERAMNAKLNGGCHVPVAGFAQIEKGRIRMRGFVGAIDGSQLLSSEEVSLQLSRSSAVELGQMVGQKLLDQGAAALLEQAYAVAPPSVEKTKPKILLTRQKVYLGNSMSILETLDYQPMHVQSIRIEPSYNASMLAQFDQLDRLTDIVFVSRNAAEIGMAIIDERGGLPDGVRTMAIGAETAKQLYRRGVDALFPQNGNGMTELLKVKPLANLSGRNILIVRGEIGLDWPAEEMTRRGAVVEQAMCYVQSPPSDVGMRLREVFQAAGVLSGVFAHSEQSIINLIEAAGDQADILRKATLVAGSQRIADAAIDHGWSGKVKIAQSPSNKHMMIAFSE